MDWLRDNAIELSAIFLGVVVVVALIVLAAQAARLWLRTRAARRRLDAGRVGLEASLEQLEQKQAALPRRQAELDEQVGRLQSEIEALKVLVRYAAEASDALRSPLRYLGR